MKKLKELHTELEDYKREELTRLKDELTPYFENFKLFEELCVIGDALVIKYTCGDLDWIVTIDDDSFCNDFKDVYDLIGVKREDVFEEVGEELEEIKVKPPKEFDINEWKKAFVEKYEELHFDDCKNVIFIESDTGVISFDNDVNYIRWHDGKLTGHHKFKFDFSNEIKLKTKKDCEAFEQIFDNYVTLKSNTDYIFDKLNNNAYIDIYNYLVYTQTDEQVQWLVENIIQKSINSKSKADCFNALISYHIEMCIQDTRS